MEFINLHVSVLDSAEFLQATDAQRSTWLCLYRYCAGQENGGRIDDAGKWSDRVWAQLGRVSGKVVRKDSTLWKWEGESLVVGFYNTSKEREVNRLRSQAVAAAHARWHRQGTASAMPAAVPDGLPTGMPSGNVIGFTEGNGREGKGKEYPPTPAGGEGATTDPKAKRERPKKPGSVLPSEQAPEIAERMKEVGALMGRRASTPWTAAEFDSFRAQRLDSCSAADFAEQLAPLRTYYGASIPREKDFRRRELATLLNNLPGELDKARAWLRDHNDGITKV